MLHFFSMAGQPSWVFSLLRFEYHTQTQHTIGLLSTSDRPFAETSAYNIQQSQGTNIHAPGTIRTCTSSKRAAADKRLRPRGHRDRQPMLYNHIYFVFHPCYLILATEGVVKWNTLSHRPKSSTYMHNINSFKTQYSSAIDSIQFMLTVHNLCSPAFKSRLASHLFHLTLILNCTVP
jgi:hypothetical protein